MEELLMCSVCIERYHESKRHPVLLPRCGHSFCRPCVAMLVSGGCIVCPTCRTDQRIEFVERLPTEYTLLAIIHAQENNKKETCEKHSVKLSFFCRTCEIATCGECLFEDHPTHSHDVIRASKYISDMKQHAQDVAVRFIEVLDEREQNYYRIIFNCAKRISSAIRNISVLRRDMEEARELMKGIKEDESISAATSLSEAAKFLGLKWNIQDANYQRNVQEENAKDEIEIEKKRAQEEDAKQQQELKEQEGKKSKEKGKDKSSKKLRKSKTLSSVEMAREVEQFKNKEENESTEVKEKASTENIEKAETKPETETKKEPEGNDGPEKQNESEPKTPNENQKEPDESKPKEPEKPEENKPAEVKIEVKPKSPKEIVKTEEITIEDIIKRKDQLKKPDDNYHNEVKQQNAKNDKILDLKLRPPKIHRIKPIPKKVTPPPPTIMTEEKEQQTDPIEIIPEKEKEANKSESNKPSEVDANDSKSVKEGSKNAVSEKTKGKEEDRKSNGGENEESDEEEEDDIKEIKENAKKEESGAAAVGNDENSGLSASSQERKYRDPLEDSSQNEGKLMDFIQVPGFMLCIEAADGRLAAVDWGPQGLHVHCLQFTHVTYDLVLRDSFLNALIPSKNPMVFLELTADHTILGRVYIKLWGHLKRAHNFLSLCLGEQGKSYINTKFLQVYNVNGSGERILGGDYEHNNGRGGRGLLDELEWNCDYAMPMKAGMITAAGSGQPATNSLFLICTQSDPTRNFSCPFGIVCEGIKVVKEAVQQTATKQVWITDCGVVLVPPKFEYKYSNNIDGNNN